MRAFSSGFRAHQPSVPSASGVSRDVCATSKKRTASPSMERDNKRQRVEEKLKSLPAGSFEGFAPQGPWQSHTIYGNSKEYPITFESDDDEWPEDDEWDDGTDSTDDSEYVKKLKDGRLAAQDASRINNFPNTKPSMKISPDVPDQVTAIRDVEWGALHTTSAEPLTRYLPRSLVEGASNRPPNKGSGFKPMSSILPADIPWSTAPTAHCSTPPPPAPPSWLAPHRHHWYQPSNSQGTPTAGSSSRYPDHPPSQSSYPLSNRSNSFTSHSLPKFPGSVSGYAGGYGELPLGPPGPPQALHHLNVQPHTFREGRQNNCSSSAHVLRHGEREAYAMDTE